MGRTHISVMAADEEGPPPDLFVVPSLDDQAYWERFVAVGLHQPEPAPAATNGSSGYRWVDLTDPAYQIPPAPPTIEGILYAGRRHVISGPPESTKTLVAYLLLLQALRADNGVAILDFEMGPHAAVTLLRELGATDAELEAVHYTEPDAPPMANDIARLTGMGVGYVLLDAAAGAYDTTGLDDNSRKDAETFAGHWIRPLWQAGIATIVIDHVTKNADTRGKFTIGSERKTGQADVHLSLEALKPLHRGGTGKVKITVHKDRPGHLPRPTLYVIDLASDEDTHHITWAMRDPHPTDAAEGYFRPTKLMERVSQWLEETGGEWSGHDIEKAVEGKGTGIRSALIALTHEGKIGRDETGRGYKYRHLEAYRERDDLVPTETQYPSGNSDLVPPRPTSSPSRVDDLVPRPLSLDRDEDGIHIRIDVTDEAVQALLDDPEY